jgi:hypothetical protein
MNQLKEKIKNTYMGLGMMSLDFSGWILELVVSSFDAHKYNHIPKCISAIFQVSKCQFIIF